MGIQFSDNNAIKLISNNFDYQLFTMTYSAYHDIELFYDVTNKIVRIYIDDTLSFELNNNDLFSGNPITAIGIHSPSAYFSNFIIQQEHIDNEKLIMLSTSSILSEWTSDGDGSYAVTETGKKLMHNIDTESLVTKIGTSQAIINSISAYMAPAYCEGTALKYLKTILNGDNSETILRTDSLTGIDKIATSIPVQINVSNVKSVGWESGA